MADTQIVTTKYRTKALKRRSHVQNYQLAGGQNGGQYYYNPTTSTSTVGSLGTLTVFDQRRTSIRQSEYWTLIKSGAYIPDKPYSFTRNERFPGRLNNRYWTGSGSLRSRVSVSDDAEYYEGWTLNPSGFASPLTRFSLQVKLLTKQRGNTWQAPVFFLEGKKTASMVANRAADLIWLVRSLRRGRVNEFLEALTGTISSQEKRRHLRDYARDRNLVGPSKASANLWLETQYGWVPLMSDVHDAMNALMDLSDRPSALMGTTRARIRSERRGTTMSRDANADTRITYTIRDSLNAVWHWKPKTGFIPSKFSLTNPAAVAWELLPFSFVADWFLPIGDYLEFLDARFTVDHIGGSYGTLRSLHSAESFGVGSSAISGGGEATMLSVSRAPMTEIPLPQLSQLWNEFEQGLQGKRIANAIALLRQNLRFLGKHI